MVPTKFQYQSFKRIIEKQRLKIKYSKTKFQKQRTKNKGPKNKDSKPKIKNKGFKREDSTKRNQKQFFPIKSKHNASIKGLKTKQSPSPKNIVENNGAKQKVPFLHSFLPSSSFFSFFLPSFLPVFPPYWKTIAKHEWKTFSKHAMT